MPVSLFLKNPQAEKSPIYIRLIFRNAKFRHTTEISIDTKMWNPKTQTIRDQLGTTSYKTLNARLKAMREACELLESELMASPVIPTSEEFWKRFYLKLDGTARAAVTFTEYLGEYAQRRKRDSLHNTAKQYLTAYNWLVVYEQDTQTKVHFADVTLRFYHSFRRWFLRKGYTLNTLGTVVKSFKVAYRDARDVDGLHDLHETEKRGFSSANYAAKTVYLSLEELQRIAEVEITPETVLKAHPELKTGDNSLRANLARKVESLRIVRNKFLLGAYTALRVSDFNALRDVHVHGDFFRITTQKTGAQVVIPIHPVIRKMMDDGFDITTPITDQKINKHIKEVAKMAGITQLVEGTKVETQLVEGTKLKRRRAVVGFFPKCDIITTHTARRSAATNMYKAGIPSISIMRITGHTTEKAFMKDIKITAEENAELMAKNKFFAG